MLEQLLLNYEDNENNEDSNDESEDSINSNNWNIKYEAKKIRGNNYRKSLYIYKPDISPACKAGNYNMKEYTNKNIKKYFIVDAILNLVEKKSI